MSRPLRIETPGGVFHVTSRGNARKAIFLDAIDRCEFLGVLSSVLDRYLWRCLAWCLMDNHYHLVVQTLEPTLSIGMRQINGVYARRFNSRHERVGHLFQGRFKASLVESDEHLAEVIEYTLLNPVRAGLVENPSEWEWSSWRSTVALAGEALALSEAEDFEFRPESSVDRPRFRHREIAPSPASGSRAFVAARISEQPASLSPEVPSTERAPDRALRLHRPWTDDQFHSAYLFGLSMREIAALADCHYSTVSRRVRRHERSA
jgi:putative transposase